MGSAQITHTCTLASPMLAYKYSQRSHIRKRYVKLKVLFTHYNVIMIKKIKIPLVSAIISALIYHFSNTELIIGKSYNYFFPCKQEIVTSLPCYIVWDYITMLITAVIFAISIIWILVIIVKDRGGK